MEFVFERDISKKLTLRKVCIDDLKLRDNSVAV